MAAAYNRHLRGKTNDIQVPVKGNIEVLPGDFMFKFANGGAIGAAVDADNYAYPFNLAVNSASAGTQIAYAIYQNFLGVAMTGSELGVTGKVVVATSGIFRYPIYSLTGVTIGSLVSSVSPQASDVGVSRQAVAIYGSGKATTAYLGHIAKTESGASFVDFEISTIYTKLAS